MGNKIIAIHLASNLKPNQKDGNSDENGMLAGLNKKTVEILKSVNKRT